MARSKETIWQKDFSLGEVRPEAEERDDTDLVLASAYRARNTISLSTGQLRARPGTVKRGTTTASTGFDVDLGNGRKYELQIKPDGYVILNRSSEEVHARTNIDWEGLGDYEVGYDYDDINFWIVASPDTSSILIGSEYFDLRAITVDVDGDWSFGRASYPTGQNGVPSVPFYNPRPGSNIRVIRGSGKSVTIEAENFDLFTSSHVGTYIRQNGVPILIDAVTDARTATGTSKGPISRTIEITVADGSDFFLGDVVEHKNLGGQGLITDIDGNDLTIFSLGSYKDFDATGNLIGPNAKESIASYSAVNTGAYVALWDIQMFSGAYGYPAWGQLHKGRLYLCGYPSDSLAFAASQANDILNFTTGVDDADAFVEKLGVQNGGELLYIISAEDLLFMTTRGLYYQPSRDGSAITPLTIAPVSFSKIGVAKIRPMAVDEGAVFVDSVGEQIYAAVLVGDIYRSWRAQPISKYHSDLIKEPKHLGATVWGSEEAEQFIYVVNEDGTLAVCQWDKGEGKVSWRSWPTIGDFVAVYQSISRVHAITDRTINGVTTRFYERFYEGIYVDCASGVRVSTAYPEGEEDIGYLGGTTEFATHLEGEAVQVYCEGWDYGDLLINSDGKPTDGGVAVSFPTDEKRIVQMGLALVVNVTPWSRRSVSTQRGTREVKRVIDFYATVQSTGVITIDGQSLGGYAMGDDLTTPPPLRTTEYRVAIAGNKSFERIPIRGDRPGPFLLLKTGYRVVV